MSTDHSSVTDVSDSDEGKEWEVQAIVAFRMRNDQNEVPRHISFCDRVLLELWILVSLSVTVSHSLEGMESCSRHMGAPRYVWSLHCFPVVD